MRFQMDRLVSVRYCIILDLVYYSTFCPSLSLSDSSEHLVIVFRELDALTDWKSLGLQLGLNFSTLEKIENEQSANHRKLAMLHMWLSLRDGVKNKGGATKSALVKALYSMKENVLALRIERKGLSSSPFPNPSSKLNSTCMLSISNALSRFKSLTCLQNKSYFVPG